jgi:hypothetical protein
MIVESDPVLLACGVATAASEADEKDTLLVKQVMDIMGVDEEKVLSFAGRMTKITYCACRHDLRLRQMRMTSTEQSTICLQIHKFSYLLD